MTTGGTCEDCGTDLNITQKAGRCDGCQAAVDDQANRKGQPAPGNGGGHDLINVTHIKDRLRPLKLRIGEPALRLLQVLVESYVEAGAAGVKGRGRVTIGPEDLLRGAANLKCKAAGSPWQRAWRAGLEVEARMGRV